MLDLQYQPFNATQCYPLLLSTTQYYQYLSKTLTESRYPFSWHMFEHKDPRTGICNSKMTWIYSSRHVVLHVLCAVKPRSSSGWEWCSSSSFWWFLIEGIHWQVPGLIMMAQEDRGRLLASLPCICQLCNLDCKAKYLIYLFVFHRVLWVEFTTVCHCSWDTRGRDRFNGSACG